MIVLLEKILMHKTPLLFFLLLYFGCITLNASNIRGQIKLDDSWEPIIYLSVINSFDDLNTASYDFLIYQAEIDKKGFFEIVNLKIPKNERIYRLHICKKGDPISTIIIGGKNENFIHFIMKNNDSISIKPCKSSPEFQYSIIEGHPANNCLQELLSLQKKLNSPPDLPSAQSRELLREQILEDYISISDTSSFYIIELFTIHLINESFATFDQLGLMEKIQAKSKTSDTSSPYYKQFLSEFSFKKYQANAISKNRTIAFVIIGSLLVLLLLVVYKISTSKKSISSITNEASKLINQLSVQERKVLDLLKEGKSNKEISQELHIEVSTVKSHLNKIYSRLGVKNRKEIVNSNW